MQPCAYLLIPRLQSEAARGGFEVPPVIAGGLTSGRGSDLLFHPGRQGGEHSVAEWWDPLAGVQKARYAGVMVCARTGGAGAGSSSSNSGPVGASKEAIEPGGTLPSAAPPLSAPPRPRACVLSMRGMAAIPGRPWYCGVDATTTELPAGGGVIVTIRSPSKLRRMGLPTLLPTEAPKARRTSARVPAKRISTTTIFSDLASTVYPDSDGGPVALWHSDAARDAGEQGLTTEVLRSGLAVVGYVSLMDEEGDRLQLLVEPEDVPLLRRMLHRDTAGGCICCQATAVTGLGVTALLRRELPAVRRAVRPTQSHRESQPLAPRVWDGYSAPRASAAAAGARSGSEALAVFSCTGRGRASVFADADDDDAAACEAFLADNALNSEVPIVGAFCNGEIGPHVMGGYAGWAFSGCAPVGGGIGQGGSNGSGGACGGAGAGGTSYGSMHGEAAASAAAAAPASSSSPSGHTPGASGSTWGSGGGEQGVQLPPGSTPCCVQGWTSIYTMLG
uniref:FIST C-domain domain-containing protein n=1 Tax=Chlamydomonas euryale TaxID=1486919 RepID=A0A7R9V599_9CHLO|mmetsp:Transcript_20641/g.61559  ORF Transcript_20641/g.61559 Transcript_20641/m.61559 type:complete len:504 (+) Transcript_20641:1349-2860(+)